MGECRQPLSRIPTYIKALDDANNKGVERTLVYRNLINGDNEEARRRHEEHARETRWLDTFFVDRISVVTPRGHFDRGDQKIERPWEDSAWVARVTALQRGFDDGKVRQRKVHQLSQKLADSSNRVSSERRRAGRSSPGT